MKLTSALNKMTISARIRLLTLAGTLLFVLLGGGYFYGYLVTSSVKQDEARFGQIDGAVQNILTSVLKTRTMERDFVNAPGADKIALIEIEGKAAAEEIAQLQTLVTDEALASQVADVEASINAQAQSFKEIEALVKTIGFSEEEGLRGDLRSAVQSAEEKVNATNADSLTVKILMMRRHEKDFIIRGGEKYIGRLNDRVTEFKTMLADSSIDAGDQRQIAELIDAYKTSFDEFAASNVLLNQAIAEMDASFEAMLPQVEALAEQAAQGASEAAAELRSVNQLTLIVSFVIIISATLLILGAG